MELLFLVTGVGCLALFVVVIGAAFTAPKKQNQSIIERIKAQQGDEGSGKAGIRDAEEMDKSLVTRVMLPMASRFGKTFASVTPAKMVKKADEAIAGAGMIGQVTGVQITTLSWLLMIGLPIGGAFLFFPSVVQGKMDIGTVAGICGFSMLLGYRLPIGIIQGKMQARQKQIIKAMPFSMDLISVAVQAGMAFDGAMQIVSDRTQGAFSDEMKRTLREINLGISREEALYNLANRTQVEDLKNFVTAVNYIAKLGGNLTEVITVQAEALRVKRMQRAETLANQAPVKIMIPLVLFILPCVFIVILAPAGIRLFLGTA